MLRRWRYAPLPIALLRCRGFGSVLEPRVSSAQDLSASELLRTLLMVAASEPTSWLSSNSYILPHLARHLGPWPAVWAVSLLSTGLITRALTPGQRIQPFAVWLGSVSFTLPCPTSALPSASFLSEASPKAISGRTSYLHVRLAFHPYTQLIPKFFNTHGFGPPPIFTWASAWPRVDHCGFGSKAYDSPPS